MVFYSGEIMIKKKKSNRTYKNISSRKSFLDKQIKVKYKQCWSIGCLKRQKP